MTRLIIAALALTLAATDVQANDYDDCNQIKDLDRQVRGCTRITKRVTFRDENEKKFAHAVAHFNRASAYSKKGEYDRAIADYTKVLTLKVSRLPYDDVYAGRGIAYTRKGEYDRAIADFNKALELRPKDASVHYNRGGAYYKKGEYDRAIADYTANIALQPGDARAYYFRGMGHYKQGALDQAIADFRKVLEIDPSNQAAKRALSALDALDAAR